MRLVEETIVLNLMQDSANLLATPMPHREKLCSGGWDDTKRIVHALAELAAESTGGSGASRAEKSDWCMAISCL